MPAFRAGQWVKTKEQFIFGDRPEDRAHTTPDGHSVGIFSKGSRPAVLDGKPVGSETRDEVHIVRADGQNLTRMSDDRQSIVQVIVDPADCEPITEEDHLPAPRRAHLPEGKQLQP